MTTIREERVLESALRLTTAGEWSSALQLMVDENNISPSVELERSIIDLRIQAFREMRWPAPDVAWPPTYKVVEANSSGLPEIVSSELNVETLKSGVLGNGGLIVRGLMDSRTVEEMRGNIDRTLLCRQGVSGESEKLDLRSWYSRSKQIKGGPIQFFASGGVNHTDSASVWAVDSPRTASQLIQFYQRMKLPQLLHDYFSEPATLSVKKWVLRRVAPNNGGQAGWHQDGRFLGDNIRSINMWIALTDCGGDADAPGMDIIRGSNGTIYETGTRGAPYDWTVGQGLVDEISQKNPVLNPRFNAGDALFFDHYNLHRTGFGDSHSSNRYALEAWFFAASTVPAKQIPVFL